MLPKINPTTTKAWKKLKIHHLVYEKANVMELFEADPKRFDKFSFGTEDFLFDFSKNIATDKTMELLTDLAEECQLSDAIDALLKGEKINETENRAVLHTALRDFSDKEILVDGKNIKPLIKAERIRIEKLCEQIHSGSWNGYTGKKIKYIVNIGIGGSDLGSSMVTEALRPYWLENIKPFFISNIDGSNLCEVVDQINFEEALFIVASKTFTTQETITNAQTVRKMFVEHCKDEKHIQKHFIAITGNKELANAFGIPSENIFEIWDWVCGRFSLWGSMGITIALTIGYTNFEELLNGANSMDEHFEKTEFNKNIPVLMALLSIWYINFFNTRSEAVLAYDHHLSKFKAYLQQGAMESNGKSIDRSGNEVDYQTGVVIWGESGTNGQHSFHQLLHQGTEITPCDFILTVKNKHGLAGHNKKLLANALAQTEALMKGRNKEETELVVQDVDKQNVCYKTFQGSKPTNTILIKDLTSKNLGVLLACYEHKIFVQGVIWNIFSFDQWGVELGKGLSGEKLEAIQNKRQTETFDQSTKGLIGQILRFDN
ncbi:MAG: glucose-6-phosphate isomerase [Crocinitomicaceae bacterium]|nr:glucose-6-phosphate isomerase [Crocinitomicaceae bacterium]